MITREQALAHIAELPPIDEVETLPLQACKDRIVARDVCARLTHPPAAMSAMDGYAVRFQPGLDEAPLRLIGEAAAGAPFSGMVETGECVRVFTGSVIPDGADHVVIQEDVRREGETVWIEAGQEQPRNIRPAGVDFREGDVLLTAGSRIRAAHLSICAAANHASLTLRRRPRVGLLTNGDELRPPGSPLQPGQIIASNEYALMGLIAEWGGEPVNLGTAKDDPEDIRERIETAGDLDVFVPVGGASVGDHDHMKTVFTEVGFESVFSKIAIKPGKPTWHSRRKSQCVLGLPGNPASALVCAHIFLRSLVQRLLGQETEDQWVRGKLTTGLSPNGAREAFLRGTLGVLDDGALTITPASNQDSSLLRPFVTADVLLHRASGAPALKAGDIVAGIKLS
ncbi:MAG: molybdopterin molybdotransferase MoeA [Hyphomonadaceae bacterium]|nr:molybdopterin molybdotransferase MoeA [Hyphomonadaceae bacterium]